MSRLDLQPFGLLIVWDTRSGRGSLAFLKYDSARRREERRVGLVVT